MKPITKIHLALDDIENNLESLRTNVQIIEGNQKAAKKSITIICQNQNSDDKYKKYRVKGDCAESLERLLGRLLGTRELDLKDFTLLKQLGELLEFNDIVENRSKTNE